MLRPTAQGYGCTGCPQLTQVNMYAACSAVLAPWRLQSWSPSRLLAPVLYMYLVRVPAWSWEVERGREGSVFWYLETVTPLILACLPPTLAIPGWRGQTLWGSSCPSHRPESLVSVDLSPSFPVPTLRCCTGDFASPCVTVSASPLLSNYRQFL
jgi:hypothetical protein